MLDMNNPQDLEDVKFHIRVDFDESDSEIKRMVAAAQSVLIGAIGSEHMDFYSSDKAKDLFDLATLFLVDHFYKTRSATTSLKFSEVPYSVQSMILSLKPEYAIYSKGV